MKKLSLILAVTMMLGMSAMITGCGGSSESDVAETTEETVSISPQVAEMVGTYSVDDIGVTNSGRDLGIKESDLNVCKTVEVTEEGKIICKGLFDDNSFEIIYDKIDDDYLYKTHTKEASYAGYNSTFGDASRYAIDAEYEGPTSIDYLYADNDAVKELNLDYMNKGCMHVYLKFKGGTEGWYAYLFCSKLD